jgi:multicomponent K+:H+ antiporter subunit G
MTWDMVLTAGVIASLIVGLFFTFVAAIGLLKLNNAMSRLHAPTKAGTIGIGSFLLASVLNSYLIGDGSLRELLILGFLFVTAPISANFLAKVNIHSSACTVPPPPPRDDNWATLNVPEADRELAETTTQT